VPRPPTSTPISAYISKNPTPQIIQEEGRALPFPSRYGSVMPDDHRRLKTPNGNPKAFVYLGSAQKELWSSVGITRVTFIILATATISQITS
jgi:hypothetical protein